MRARLGLFANARRSPRQNGLHPYTIDVLSCQDDAGATALQLTALLYERRERRCASALGAIVGRGIDQADRFSDIVITYLDDPLSAFPNNLERRRVRNAHRHAIGEGQRRISRNRAAGCE
jgi:hypothetical protein